MNLLATVYRTVTMSSKYKCIGVPMTELPRPSTTDKYSGIGSSLSGMSLFKNKGIHKSMQYLRFKIDHK